MLTAMPPYDVVLSPIVSWLLDSGRVAATPSLLLAGLSERIVFKGRPLWRVALNLLALHPQVVATTAVWYRDTGVSEEDWPHDPAVTVESLRSPITHTFATGQRWRCLLKSAEADSFPLLAEWRDRGATEYLSCPLPFGTGRVSTITFVTDQDDGFSDEEVEFLADVTRVLTPVAEALALRRAQAILLETYVGRHAGTRVVRENGISRNAAETLRAVILCCDLRGFTAMAETLTSQELLGTLNAYFDCVAPAVHLEGGEVLKFVGDGMLAIFPAGPDREGDAHACRRALAAVTLAQERVDVLNAERQATGSQPLRYGMGLHLGEVSYGNIGAADRLDFTVIGPAVNLVFRIEKLSSKLGRNLLVSADFAAACERPVESLGLHHLHGLLAPREVFALRAIRP